MSFWRKMNTIVFYIMMVLFVLAWIGFSIWGFFFTYFWQTGLIIFGAGLFAIPLIFTSWGIMLEFVYNVAAIRKSVCGGHVPQVIQPTVVAQAVQPTAQQAVQPTVAPAPAMQPSGSMQFTNYGTAPVNGAAPVNTVPGSSKWKCIYCGMENKADSKFCSGCGKIKV